MRYLFDCSGAKVVWFWLWSQIQHYTIIKTPVKKKIIFFTIDELMNVAYNKKSADNLLLSGRIFCTARERDHSAFDGSCKGTGN